MKIRTDFVTNSSSSSFILAFTDESTILKELAKDFNMDYIDCLPDILSSINEAERLSAEEVLPYFERNNKGAEEWILHDIMKTSMDWQESWEYIRSEKGQRIVLKKVSKNVSQFKKKLKDKNVIVEVEFDDYIAPTDSLKSCSCCKAIFDHH